MSRKSTINLLAFLLVTIFCSIALAQTPTRNTTNSDTGASAPPRSTTRVVPNPKYTTPTSPLDTAYGAKIAEYTTEKYFLTELVDHLPAV